MTSDALRGTTKPVLNEQWARDVSVRIDTVRGQLAVARAEHPDMTPALKEAAANAERALDEADAAVSADGRSRGRSLVDHWRGLSVVSAYENLHAAEAALVDVLTHDQLRCLVPSVLERARTMLEPESPIRGYVESLAEQRSGTHIDRPSFRQALWLGYHAENQVYLRIRMFRNLLIKCTGLLCVLMIIMVALVGAHPRSMPLCFTPAGATGSTGATGSGDSTVVTAETVCPSGDHRDPAPDDIWIVAGLGLLGSAAAAALSLRHIRGVPTPYDVPVALAFFKLPLGALTAVAGLLLLGGGFVPGLSELDNQRQILAYALAFGYAQQLVSRLVDMRARQIVGRLSTAPSDRPAQPRTAR